MCRNLFLLLIIFVFFINGCAVVLQKGRRSDIEKIQSLENELQTFKNAKDILTQQLSQEIKDKQVRLEMAQKGLVITFVAEVLYDSGKADLKEQSLPVLNKVVKILKEEVPGNNIMVEGHTDNEPIKYSRWKTNWELSTQRALSVLYHLESGGVNPLRLSAAGYGQYKPVASNDTIEGRQFNRRVEVVILPKIVKKMETVEEEKAGQEEAIEDQEEELK
ncbi:MAG: OmpA family protein [Candidatus Omnitrophota bacterium]